MSQMCFGSPSSLFEAMKSEAELECGGSKWPEGAECLGLLGLQEEMQ